jgi:hypothetical protein
VGQFFGWLWEVILDGWDALRDFVRGVIDDFRDSTRFVKYKVFAIGGYIAVGLATVVVFLPPGELNEIDAEVWLRKTEIVGGRYFKVANRSSDTWKDIKVSINGTYTLQAKRLRPGRKKAFFFNRFRDESGKAPGENIQLEVMRIECSEGLFERIYRKKR